MDLFKQSKASPRPCLFLPPSSPYQMTVVKKGKVQKSSKFVFKQTKNGAFKSTHKSKLRVVVPRSLLLSNIMKIEEDTSTPFKIQKVQKKEMSIRSINS
jgi:hypothetical protein